MTEIHNSTSEVEASVAGLLSKIKPMTEEGARKHRFNISIRPRMEALGFRDRYLQDIVPIECPDQDKTFRQCEARFKGVGAIVALVGDRGVGKTYIAAKLCRTRIEKWMAYYEAQPEERPLEIPRRMLHYRKLVDIITMFKPLYADFGTIETEELMAKREELCKVDVLCIDELHECHDQKMKSRVLTDIIDRRYSNMLDTLLISNETAKAFKETVGDSVLSRLSEHGQIIACTWRSFREK